MPYRGTIQSRVVWAGMLLALGLAARGAARTSVYELCLEQSPAQAGKLTPDSGTHRFSADTVVVVAAEPQPGYQFAYWLGDVADPKSQRTTVQVNSPKVVVAIFQPARRDVPEEVLVGAAAGGGGGGGKASATFLDLSTPAWSPAGGGGKPRIDAVNVVAPVPVPVPEPATVLLLGLGALALRAKRRSRCAQ